MVKQVERIMQGSSLEVGSTFSGAFPGAIPGLFVSLLMGDSFDSISPLIWYAPIALGASLGKMWSTGHGLEGFVGTFPWTYDGSFNFWNGAALEFGTVGMPVGGIAAGYYAPQILGEIFPNMLESLTSEPSLVWAIVGGIAGEVARLWTFGRVEESHFADAPD